MTIMKNKPLLQSYKVLGNEKLFAGEYPGDKDEEVARHKIEQMYHFGIRHFIDLTEEGELRPYSHLLPADTTYTRFPIRDCSTPKSIENVQNLLLHIDELNEKDGYVYLHCWGGVGRTGVIVACYIAQKLEKPDFSQVLTILRENFSDMPKSKYRETPETKEQKRFIYNFTSAKTTTNVFFTGKDDHQVETESLGRNDFININDKIRGCLMAGASGDALGYTVEFMKYSSILSNYGKSGITKFTLDEKGKALISDDTQMTLYTANGLLNVERLNMEPKYSITHAYLDWYYTQIGKDLKTRKSCWISDIKELHSKRAPGNTCISALNKISLGREPYNNSKGCGGIMRVAPISLYAVGRNDFNDYKVAQLAADAAEITHQHPLGFMSAALLSVLIYKITGMTPELVKCKIENIIAESLSVIDTLYESKYENEKRSLKELTLSAIRLAHSELSDIDAINILGEGWVAEETWAIALYCTIRHINNIEEAIIASVNHDGDSDSTGSVCGNIMGAIYGYEHLKERNILCPEDSALEDVLELSEVITALADDLTTGCIVGKYEKRDTPEKQQWYERYYKIKSAGIQKSIK
jgi:ADP-ribosylglycohydrolase